MNIRNTYKTLDDTDGLTAYELMKAASVLMYNFDEKIALSYKHLADVEREAKALAAERSAAASSKVAVGDRHTLTDGDCKAAWETVAEVQKAIRLLEAADRFLNRVYFDAKNVVAIVGKETSYAESEDDKRKDVKDFGRGAYHPPTGNKVALH